MPTQKINPFYMAVAPYWQPGDVTLGDYLLFTAAIGLVSLLLVAATVLKIRAVCTRELVREQRPAPSAVPRGNLWRVLHRNVPWLTPSLDDNPVVWREWYRGRPSRRRIVISAIYVIGSTIFSVLAIIGPGGEFGPMVNALQVAIGLLLLSVWSATSLAEERARGSLDLLMCTPLSTRQIVTGKWLGAFRAAPAFGDLAELRGGIERVHCRPQSDSSVILYVRLCFVCWRRGDRSGNSDGDLVLTAESGGGGNDWRLCPGHGGLALSDYDVCTRDLKATN